MMATRRQRKRAACSMGSIEFALALLVLAVIGGLSSASIAMENVDIELEKLTRPTGNATSGEPQGSSSEQVERRKSANLNQTQGTSSTSSLLAKPLESDMILASEAASRPPIYRSMPKQIDSLADQPSGQQGGSADKQLAQLSNESSMGRREQGDKSVEDLNTAAGHHKKKKHKKKKKKKVIIVKKKKKKKKKKKHHEVKKKKKKVMKKKKKKKHMKKKKKHHKKKKKKKVIIVKKKKKKKKMMKKHSHQQHHYMPAYSHQKHRDHRASHHQHHEPSHHHHHHHHEGSPMPHGKYYDYRSVPKKGAWEFGFKRGNHKHMIERKEHGHKSHFKTTFSWKDKKGHGKHMFDYNHGDHKKYKHHAAAASQEAPKKLEPVISGAAMGANG